MNFCRSIVIVELWRPEVARLGKIVIFAFFWKNDSLGKFLKFCSESFCHYTDRHVVFKFREIWPTGNRQSSALLTWQKNKNSPGSPALAAAQIAPKICQSQPHTMYSECSRFHPNRLTFGGVIGLSERVNTVRARSKVNTICGWNLASNRIKIVCGHNFYAWRICNVYAYCAHICCGSVFVCSSMCLYATRQSFIKNPERIITQ